MPRSPTTSDVFNAIGERRRRRIIELLSKRELSVTQIVKSVGIAQPQVSKHLKVLRDVGIVRVRKDGRTRWYGLNPGKIKPVFDWSRKFEKFWDHQLDQLRTRAESKSGSN